MGPAASKSVWTDDGGYTVVQRDLDFVLVSKAALARLASRERPLGMSTGAFIHFSKTLRDALTASAVNDADVRLQGSAARFFSGAHKHLPSTRDEVFALMRKSRRRIPHAFELDDVLARLESLWPMGQARPSRPFFDLLYRLRIDRVRSDIDVQVSSSGLNSRALSVAAQRGVSINALRVDDPHYGFLQEDVVSEIAWHLIHWADNQSEILDRNVAVKVFPGTGPADVSHDSSAPMSSHFKDDDWILICPEASS